MNTRNACSSLLLLFLLWAGVAEAQEIPIDVIKTVAMESANQSDKGMYLVASVIVNRSRSQNKPLLAVCKAPKQFSCWNSHKWASEWCRSHFDLSTRIRAEKALKRAITTPFQKITSYHTRAIRPYWAKSMDRVRVEGAHVFYKQKGV